MGELILIALAVWLVAIIGYGAIETHMDDVEDMKVKGTQPYVDYGYEQKGWY